MTIDVDTDKRKMNLWQKLAAIMGEVDAIPKTGRNQNQQYNFIEQAVVAAKLRTYFAQYGLAIIPGMEECHQELRTTKSGGTSTHTLARATYTLVNADNPTETVTVPWYGESDDSGDKGVNKAGTSAEKYFLMKLLLLSDKDDPDAETPESVVAAESQPPVKRANIVGGIPAGIARKPAAPTTRATTPTATPAITQEQIDFIFGFAHERLGWADEAVDAECFKRYKANTAEDLNTAQAAAFIQWLKTQPVKGGTTPEGIPF